MATSRGDRGIVWAKPDWLPKKVLAPLDGSKESERALRWAAPLLERTGASLTLLAVPQIENPERLSRGIPGVTDPIVRAGHEASREIAERSRQGALQYLEGVIKGLPKAVRAQPEVALGIPADEIVRVASEMPADMIVMATRRESALVRGVLGSVTQSVLQDARLPVLVVRVEEDSEPREEGWPRVIVVPLDVTPLSEMAIGPAISLAKASGAEVRFLRVTPMMYHAAAGGAIEYIGTPIYFGEELRGEAVEYLSPFVDRARSAGVDAYADVRSGSVAGGIVDALEELPASLAVMTTHARGGLRRLALGSVADKVVRSSARPVLLLPAPQEE